ncbi:uncharacterized protein LOC116535726 [Sapajus apella]|uniref:Uncharacterized protein LOC116535726 n=1 Tax=Sapajus apella TaxID=9515 RepID=A0A6J3G4B0_SAPAP|nr:uncharacterized protein LOC116535726 [Sapajus apella]
MQLPKEGGLLYRIVAAEPTLRWDRWERDRGQEALRRSSPSALRRPSRLRPRESDHAPRSHAFLAPGDRESAVETASYRVAGAWSLRWGGASGVSHPPGDQRRTPPGLTGSGRPSRHLGRAALSHPSVRRPLPGIRNPRSGITGAGLEGHRAPGHGLPCRKTLEPERPHRCEEPPEDCVPCQMRPARGLSPQCHPGRLIQLSGPLPTLQGPSHGRCAHASSSSVNHRRLPSGRMRGTCVESRERRQGLQLSPSPWGVSTNPGLSQDTTPVR